MKIEAEIWTVQEGQIKEIKLGDKTFVLQEKTLEKEQLSRNTKKKMTLEHHKKLGVTYITNYQGMKIIKELCEDLLGEDDINKRLEIIKKYYPYVSEDSLKRYEHTYRSFKPKKVVIKKYHKRKPPVPNAKFSKKYYTWVKPEEIREVRRCIGMVKYNYRPTVKAISGETNIPEARVRAVLDVLIREGSVYRKLDKGTPVYRFVSQD